MTIYRFSARARNYDRGTLFPAVMAGLMGLWALFALAIACGPKLVALEAENAGTKAFVSCEPTTTREPGQLLRCIVELDSAIAKDI